MIINKLKSRVKPLHFLLIFALLFSGNLFADKSSEHNEEKGDDFNAGEMILHHVKDAHTIHIGPLHVPLPIILVDDGLKMFSSSAFYHNEKHLEIGHGEDVQKVHYYEHDGYILFHEKIYKAKDGGLVLDEHGHPKNEKVSMDLSITKNVAGLLLGLLVLFLVMLSVAKAYKRGAGKAPKGIQNVIEIFVLFIRDEVAKPSIGKGYEKFVPFLLNIFFFIWTLNLLGLIPFLGGLNVTGNIAVTMVLASFVLILQVYNANGGFWKHMVAPPGVPLWLLPLMIPIELFGFVIKPVVLTLRLFANITAGHIIILSFTSLIFIFSAKFGAGAGYGTSIVAVAFSVFMNVLELLVAFLQAYVFTLLAAIYFGMATEEAHH